MVGTSDESGDTATPTMTRGERVRAAARTLRKPRTASWIAEETDVSVQTAQKYLDQLVEDNVLQKTEQGDRARYSVDQLMASYREIATLQREHTREELTSSLESMRSSIVEWQSSYDVETPGELRASVANLENPDEMAERRDIASEWEHLADRIPIVRAALAEYDWADERTARA